MGQGALPSSWELGRLVLQFQSRPHEVLLVVTENRKPLESEAEF